MNAEEIRVDEILSDQLLGAVEEEAQTLFWLDGHGGITSWLKANDDTRARYIYRAKAVVALRLEEGRWQKRPTHKSKNTRQAAGA